MTKLAKTFLIIAGSLVVIGIILCTIFFARMDWRWDRVNDFIINNGWRQAQIYVDNDEFDNLPVGQQEASYDAAEINKLVVETAIDNIRIYPAEDNEQIRIVYYDRKGYRYQLSDSNNTIRIKGQAPRGSWLNWLWSGDSELKSLEIWLPVGSVPELQLEAVSGKMELSALQAERLQAESVSGKIELINCQIGEMQLEAVSGKMELEKTSGKKLTAGAVSGEIELDGCDLEELRLETVSGKMELENCSLQRLQASSVSGDIKAALEGNSDDYRIDVETVSGNARSDRGADSSPLQISLETISGNIDLDFSQR